jgi:hypothetical protein
VDAVIIKEYSYIESKSNVLDIAVLFYSSILIRKNYTKKRDYQMQSRECPSLDFDEKVDERCLIQRRQPTVSAALAI